MQCKRARLGFDGPLLLCSWFRKSTAKAILYCKSNATRDYWRGLLRFTGLIDYELFCVFF